MIEKIVESFHPVKSPAVVLGVLGALLVMRPETAMAGFATWLVANALWVYEGWNVKDYHVVLLFGVYFVIAGSSLLFYGGAL